MSLRSGARVVAFYRFLHATISQQILADEQDMANWLAQHLPEAVQEIIKKVEVLSLVGDIAVEESKPRVHMHVVVGLADGTTRGGHILEAHVWPTLEVIVVESPRHLRRKTDPETGLALISL